MTERALTDNAADRKQVKDVRKREQQRTQRERANLESVLGSKQGRAELWKQLCDSGVFRTSFAGDPYQTAFNEGRRQQGLALMARIMEINPDYYHLMAKDAHELDEMTKAEPSKPQPSDTEETES